jgi:acid phosphatase type 7
MLASTRLALLGVLSLSFTLPLFSQEGGAAKKQKPEDLPTSGLISANGPSFRVSKVSKTTTFIVYGDQRFTDPVNTKVTSPKARRWLVQQIATEKPDAILLNGDVPYSGDVVNDYEVYATESLPWREEHIHVFPALGNHEFHGDPQQALDHWWAAFPEMRNRRWYSARLGKAIYTISLDSDASLLPGSDQEKWFDIQAGLRTRMTYSRT